MGAIEECYHVLGLAPGASPDAVKQAYRDLVRVWHPDRFGNDPRLQSLAQEKLKSINLAYHEITEFQKRGVRHEPPKVPETYRYEYTYRPPEPRTYSPPPPPHRPRHEASGFSASSSYSNSAASAATAAVPPAYEWFFKISKILFVLLSINLVRMFLVHCTGAGGE